MVSYSSFRSPIFISVSSKHALFGNIQRKFEQEMCISFFLSSVDQASSSTNWTQTWYRFVNDVLQWKCAQYDNWLRDLLLGQEEANINSSLDGWLTTNINQEFMAQIRLRGKRRKISTKYPLTLRSETFRLGMMALIPVSIGLSVGKSPSLAKSQLGEIGWTDFLTLQRGSKLV